METRLEIEMSGKQPGEVKELVLDNCNSKFIVGLTDEFQNLESLSLNSVGLTSLKGFPKLPNLKKLELSGNSIKDGLKQLLSSPQLVYINLSDNELCSLSVLEPLKELKFLETLKVSNNKELVSIPKYRENIFQLIPSLKYIDGLDGNDAQCDPEKEEEQINGKPKKANETENGDDTAEEKGEEEEGDDSDDDEDYSSESELGLSAVYDENLEDDSEEFELGDDDRDDDDDTIDSEKEEEEEGDSDEEKGESSNQGVKRKHEKEGEEESAKH